VSLGAIGSRIRGIRRRVVQALLRTRGSLRRMPPSPPLVPRPPRVASGARTLRLARALVASDLNRYYLDCWPLARHAWKEVAGLEPALVLVAPAAEVPEELRRDELVHVFEPVAGVSTAFQAQCIRLLYPALLPNEGGVVTSDIDMFPMNRRYFERGAEHVDPMHFVAYRDVLVEAGEMAICYNAALPPTWGEIFDIRTLDDVRQRLIALADGVEYGGIHGGAGWNTDQLVLFRALLDWGRRTRRLWILDDHYTGFRRLDGITLRKVKELDERHRRLLRRGAYSDFHAVHPFAVHAELNELVVDLAAATAGRRRAPRVPATPRTRGGPRS
jgi:hypothetical protein